MVVIDEIDVTVSRIHRALYFFSSHPFVDVDIKRNPSLVDKHLMLPKNALIYTEIVSHCRLNYSTALYIYRRIVYTLFGWREYEITQLR